MKMWRAAFGAPLFVPVPIPQGPLDGAHSVIADRSMQAIADSRWYCVKAKPGQDQIAISHLRRQQFEIYYPRISVERFKAGKVVRESVPLFPSYVLVRFALQVSTWRSINGTRGVLRLLSFNENGQPSAIPPGQIEQLQQAEKSGKLFVSEILRLRRGDRIRMKFGASVDQMGEVLRTRGERVEFLLRLFGRTVRCIAPQHALELVGPRAKQHQRISAAALSPKHDRMAEAV